MAKWVKVEFYGLLPDDVEVTMDPAAINDLGALFGFEAIDALAVTPAQIDGTREENP